METKTPSDQLAKPWLFLGSGLLLIGAMLLCLSQEQRWGERTLGVQLNWTLYNGGLTQNRVRETAELEIKSRSDLDAARRTVSQSTRQAYFAVQSGSAQVKALEAAEASSRLALEATQVGYRVGVRVNLDVLNAQTQLFQTRRDLAKARYDVLMGGLRLRLASGQLKVEDLAGVSGLLAR